MNPRLPKRGGTSILGLAFDGDRLEGTVVRRMNGHAEVRKTFAVSLSVDPLTNAPELVGREIRKHLDAAGIRERRCAVCIPTHWILTLQIRLPELAGADLASFLQLEAERGFPYAPETLILSQSRFRAASGESFVTLAAIPRDHIIRLEESLEAAQLKPVTFSLGIVAMQPPEGAQVDGVLALVPGVQRVSLQVTQGGGVSMLRTLEGAFEHAGGTPQLQPDSLIRELRITLGQLPPELRASVRQVRVFGKGEAADQLFEELELRVASWEMSVERVSEYPPDAFPVKLPPGTPVSAAVSLALNCLTGRGATFEFLPPKVSALEKFSARYASRKLVLSGVLASSVAAVVAVLFLVQQFQLWYWESKWQVMSKPVSELEVIQKQIRRYRPWFDDTCRTLNILKKLSEAFPEDGTLAAKSVEIRDPAMVICSGTARDRQAVIRAMEKLRASAEISAMKLERVDSRSTPAEFTFNFHWTDRGGL